MNAKERKIREIEEATKTPLVGPWRLLAAVFAVALAVFAWMNLGNACAAADKCEGAACPNGTEPITVQADKGWTCICAAVAQKGADH